MTVESDVDWSLYHALYLTYQGGSWQPDDFFESFEETPYHIAILTYLGYALMVVIGHVRDFMRRYGLEQDKSVIEPKVEVGIA